MAVASPRASERDYRFAQLSWSDSNLKEWIRENAIILNGVLQGNSNATGTFSLAHSVAATTLVNSFIGSETVVLWSPTTANASAEVGAGTIYQTYPNANEGKAVINHANSATAGRTFAYTLSG